MFNPQRLTLARQRRKLTKKAFAEALKVNQKTVVRWEAGAALPSADNIEAFASKLGFPVEFFSGADLDVPEADAVSFRALSTMPARDRNAALAASAFGFVLGDWVETQFNLPAPDLIDFKEGIDPEAAAEMLRQKWALGVRPVRNVVHLLEAKGIRVFSLNENTRTLDGISMWRREIPYIFLNTTKTAERSRYDASHELAHLCLHKHGGPGGRLAEEQANAFASAFLMPRAEIIGRMPRVDSLNQIVEAKKYWKVSVAALNYRLHKLGITSEWQYQRFCIQIQERFGVKEPYGVAREVSQVWGQVFGALRADGVVKHSVANVLALPVDELESLIFGLANMQSIDGGGTTPVRSRARLAVVGKDATRRRA